MLLRASSSQELVELAGKGLFTGLGIRATKMSEDCYHAKTVSQTK